MQVKDGDLNGAGKELEQSSNFACLQTLAQSGYSWKDA